MLAVDRGEGAIGCNLRLWLLWEYVQCLLELESIGDGLALIEQQYGLHEDLEAVRQRLHLLRVTAIESVRALLVWDTPPETIH